jgi:hypothetical protein
MGFAGYPTLRLMCLAETGTRALLGATIGAAGDRDEATLAVRLLPLLRPGMLVLLDRGFDSTTFLTAVHRTGAMLLARVRSQRVPPVLQHLPDGSYLSDLDGLAVRIIEVDLAMRGADGTQVGDRYRLITTLLDADRFPARALVRLYHALQTARDQLILAARLPDPTEPTDLLGVIGRAVLATLLPARRARYSARKVKCATSRYLNRDDGRPAASTTVTAIDIHVHTPPLDLTPRSRRAPARPRGPRPPTRRQRVTALLDSDPRRAWSGAELAERLQVPATTC